MKYYRKHQKGNISQAIESVEKRGPSLQKLHSLTMLPAEHSFVSSPRDAAPKSVLHEILQLL
ncbi:hypothetical protein FRX31_034975 [Thalictrum thalictroides]|uniref:Uncharacterized protein n=1 Tax=Thalictrum thalictroides TaxID=46969 RepID=A0A7J6UT65_THATH|nr:hypothetical protein FRX31_034975 [Thalictrum thalictroides]